MLYVELKRLVSWEFGQQECQLGGRQWWYRSKGFRSEQRFYWQLGLQFIHAKVLQRVWLHSAYTRATWVKQRSKVVISLVEVIKKQDRTRATAELPLSTQA